MPIYFNSILFPLISFIRFGQSIFKQNELMENKLPCTIINKFLTNVFSFEKQLIGKIKIPFGLSLLTVIQKKQKEFKVVINNGK